VGLYRSGDDSWASRGPKSTSDEGGPELRGSVFRPAAVPTPAYTEVYNYQPRTRVQGLGHGAKKYTRQTPTKNDFFKGTVPVFGIRTREIPVNTKEILRLF
jgi:hypothetical protein